MLASLNSCFLWTIIFNWLCEFLYCRTNSECILHHFFMACATPPLVVILQKLRNLWRYTCFCSNVFLWFNSTLVVLSFNCWSMVMILVILCTSRNFFGNNKISLAEKYRKSIVEAWCVLLQVHTRTPSNKSPYDKNTSHNLSSTTLIELGHLRRIWEAQTSLSLMYVH